MRDEQAQRQQGEEQAEQLVAALDVGDDLGVDRVRREQERGDQGDAAGRSVGAIRKAGGRRLEQREQEEIEEHHARREQRDVGHVVDPGVVTEQLDLDRQARERQRPVEVVESVEPVQEAVREDPRQSRHALLDQGVSPRDDVVVQDVFVVEGIRVEEHGQKTEPERHPRRARGPRRRGGPGARLPRRSGR